MSTPALPDPTLPDLRPDSWGVWFPDDPKQVPWQRFLDEASAAGYEWIELGPYGYLPTDPAQLSDELESRGLKLSAGTVFTGFHKGEDQFQRAWDQAVAVAGLAQSTVSQHLKVLRESGLVCGEIEGAATSYCLDFGTLDWFRRQVNGFADYLVACC